MSRAPEQATLTVPEHTGPRTPKPTSGPSPEDRQARLYLRVTVFVTVAMVAGALLEWIPAAPSPWRWLPLGLAYLVGGGPILRDTVASLRKGRLSIDFLMGTAALGAAAVGQPLEGVILIFLFSLSNTLEAHAIGRTRRAMESLMTLHPEEATLLEDGEEERRVAVEELTPGDQVLVRPGERIPADGKVARGRSRVDQSTITGESIPVGKGSGDEVFAGTINEGGVLVVRVTKPSHDTLLARIIRLVEEAREQRAPAQEFIDRFAHPYTIVVLAGSAATGLVAWGIFGMAGTDAVYRAMTILVVASPCALVISTPSAVLSGIANGARHGILFKGGGILDLAGTIDAVAFDKTGTLTVGEPRLLQWVTTEELRRNGPPRDGGEVDPSPRATNGPLPGDAAELLRLAVSVEAPSEHHLARALERAARDLGLEVDDVDAFEAMPGKGVSGRVGARSIWVGNRAMAENAGTRVEAGMLAWLGDQTSLGRSVVLVGEGGKVLGALAFGDRLRPTAAATIRHLKYEGIRWVTILSGDHPEAVRAVAAELGADDVRAGLLPHEKVEAIRELTAASRGVAMVGDGVNDAPAMAVATVGIAMGAAGTDVAIETADVVLMSDDLEKVDYVIHLGKRARRVVRQNVWFSVGWMGVLVVVAVTVGMPLTLAVVAHEGSTLLVVLNGLRLLRGGPHGPGREGDPHGG
jgi:Zn2+/Cd2+-exporting ATPase